MHVFSLKNYELLCSTCLQIVMDVGTGTGVLAIWAAQAGAKKVYAVEATPMARHAKAMVKSNGCEDVIQVIHSKVGFVR